MVGSISQETISTAVGAIKRLQASSELQEGEKHALAAVGQWLGAHVMVADTGEASLGLREGSFSSNGGADKMVEAYQEVYRPTGSARKELMLRKHSSYNSKDSMGSGRFSHDGAAAEDPKIAEVLAKVVSWREFDVFKLASLSNNHPLEHVAIAALRQLGLIEGLNLPLDKLRSFVRAVERYYPNNPYHNSCHAADVVQTLVTILQSDDDLAAELTQLELLSLVMAAIVHDVNHTGMNNDFLIRTHHELAITYNDISVNENHHLATAFRLLQWPGNECLAHLAPEDMAYVRSLMVDIVLATDMKAHRQLLADFHADFALFGPCLSDWSAVARTHVLSLIMHCADLGNTIKPMPLCMQWAKMVNEEFWEQGDRELSLGLPVSPLNDRDNADVPRSQTVFLGMVVRPCYDALARLVPATGAAALALYDENMARWEQMAAQGIMNLPA